MATHLHKVVPCKRRTSSQFTDYQLSALKKRFKSDQYIKGKEKILLAKNLGISPTAVRIWFNLERRKLKRHLANKASNATGVTA